MAELKLTTGEPAPDFTLEDLDGTMVRLSQARDRIVVINFWSAECPWSERVDRALMPDLERWGEQVTLVSVASNANEPPEMLEQAAQERRLPVVLRDPLHKVADEYAAVTTPHFFVVDTAGVLRYQGAYDDVSFRQRQATQIYLVPVVDALLAGQAPPYAETLTFGCTIVRENPGN